MAKTRGLSPRVRGNHGSGRDCHLSARSIPACAGEPRRPAPPGPTASVYPRVCGGTHRHVILSQRIPGLSPRVRGNQTGDPEIDAFIRSIPACAGEPSSRPPPHSLPRVYPRVCGGTQAKTPRKAPRKGLSPRVRGNQTRRGVWAFVMGSIPACAGEPASHPARWTSAAVYPRVCGGTRIASGSLDICSGLSPRVRGNPFSGPADRAERRSIPACAGEPSTTASLERVTKVYPRVCGGTGWDLFTASASAGLSPRVRGNRSSMRRLVSICGSIPACAGEPLSDLYLFLPSLKG